MLTSETGSLPLLRAARGAMVVSCLCSALLWPLGLGVDVQDHDESTYAELAREMVERGEYWDLQCNYMDWFGHPVLSMWVLAASFKLLGVSELAVRIPAALEVILVLALTWWLGRRLHGRAVADLSVALGAALPAMSLMGHNVKTDLNLILVMGLTIMAAWEALERPPWWVVSGVAAGLGVLTKGPIGLLLPGAVALLATLWAGRGRELGRGVVWMALGLAAFVATVLPWNLFMWGEHGARWFEALYLESTVRRFGVTTAHTETTTPLYFLHTLLWAAAPAVPFGLLSLLYRAKDVRGQWRRPPFATLDLVWLLVPLAVMSFSSMKLPHYIFPVLPGLCVLAASAVVQWVTRGGGVWLSRALRAGTLLVCLLLVVFAGAMVTFTFPEREGARLLTLFLVGASVVVVLGVGVWRGQVLPWVMAPCLAAILAVSLHNGAARPELARFNPARTVATVLDEDQPPRGLQTMVHTFTEISRMSVVFYAHVRLEDSSTAKMLHMVYGRPQYALVNLAHVQELQRANFHVRVRGFAFTFPTSRLSIPFAMVGNREDLATPLLLIQTWR
ncbi:MAG: glycosyltransferase family 39 protein [Deltaproteobacteria bacterium]|nr:glycosyltransferase family 39 protein [Deltaproteobacteria bacterium]